MSKFLLHEVGIVPKELFVTDGTPEQYQGEIRALLDATSDKKNFSLSFEPDTGRAQERIRASSHNGGLLIGSGWEKALAREKGMETFRTRDGDVEVLKGIDLEVERGDIFGVIGFSGAGKSTLLRCLNRLESPDSGIVSVNGVEITGLDKRRLNEERRKIGIIFQQFNLFDSETVFGNVAFPLAVASLPKKRIKECVEGILELVELSDKSRCHPAHCREGRSSASGSRGRWPTSPSSS